MFSQCSPFSFINSQLYRHRLTFSEVIDWVCGLLEGFSWFVFLKLDIAQYQWVINVSGLGRITILL